MEPGRLLTTGATGLGGGRVREAVNNRSNIIGGAREAVNNTSNRAGGGAERLITTGATVVEEQRSC